LAARVRSSGERFGEGHQPRASGRGAGEEAVVTAAAVRVDEREGAIDTVVRLDRDRDPTEARRADLNLGPAERRPHRDGAKEPLSGRCRARAGPERADVADARIEPRHRLLRRELELHTPSRVLLFYGAALDEELVEEHVRADRSAESDERAESPRDEVPELLQHSPLVPERRTPIQRGSGAGVPLAASPCTTLAQWRTKCISRRRAPSSAPARAGTSRGFRTAGSKGAARSVGS